MEDLEIPSYAGDTTIYMVNKKNSQSLLHFGWFNNNFMKADNDKSHLIINYTETTTAMVDCLLIDSSKTEVLLGITIDQLTIDQ